MSKWENVKQELQLIESDTASVSTQPPISLWLHVCFTSRHDSLQVDHIGMVKLAHDARLAQEVPPLLLRVAHFQGLDGDRNVPLSGQLQSTAAHLPKLSCGGSQCS